jgi:hypothetical protein
MTGFKCMNRGCKNVMYMNTGKMFWKWKDNTKMTKVHVCEKCWSRAKSLKCD